MIKRKMIRARIASILLSAMLVTGGSTAYACADAYDLPDTSRWTIFVAGTNVTKTDEIELVEGITYDWDSDILTMENFSYEGTNFFTYTNEESAPDDGAQESEDYDYEDCDMNDYDDDFDGRFDDEKYVENMFSFSGVIYRHGNLSIVLKGDNHITVDDEPVPEGFSYAPPINVSGNVTYLGTGSLQITNSTTGVSRMIYGSDRSLNSINDSDSEVEFDTFDASGSVPEDERVFNSEEINYDTSHDKSVADGTYLSNIDSNNKVQTRSMKDQLAGNFETNKHTSESESTPSTGDTADFGFMLITLGSSLAGILIYLYRKSSHIEDL